MIVLALALAGCPSDPACTRNSECAAGSYCSGGACVTDCTPESVEDDCGEGASCSSFGMCVSPPDAGPPPDASRSDGGADAPDMRAACVVAGGVDTDGDGYCVTGTDADCDDSDSSTNPGELEICTARTASLENRAIDENCDGEIDEDCPWHFGTLHSVVPVHSGSSIHEGGQLSSDGLRLYVRGYDASGRFALTLSARPSLTTPFAAPSVVATADLIGRPIGDAALSADELELFVDDDRGAPQSDIYRATRLTRDAAFGPLVAVTELNSPTDRDYALTLSRDGLEVFYARQGTDGARRLLRATRPSPTTPFGAAEPVTIPGSTLGDAGIAFSEDGLTAFVQRLGASGSRVFRLERASRETAVFDSAVEVIEVGDSGVSYTSLAWVDERHREAFFISTRPWAPATLGFFRAEVCRDGPCADQAIPCADGTRSPDQLHCYTLAAAPSTRGNAAAACVAIDGHLASIHSAAEHNLIWSSFGATDQWRWIGLQENAATGVWSWDGGTTTTYLNWYAGEPQPARDEPFATMAPPTGLWADWAGSAMHRGICERELWPTW